MLLETNALINMQVYAKSLAQNADLKYQDIAPFLPRDGFATLSDEGCADGSLLAEISRKHSYGLFGVDLDPDLLRMASERTDYGRRPTLVRRDLTNPEGLLPSTDVVIANSVLHELYSYAGGADTVRKYLRDKFKQLQDGGRLIIRDVVGPTNPGREVYLWTEWRNGVATSQPELWSPDKLSTRSLFLRFTREFSRPIPHTFVSNLRGDGDVYVRLALRDAMDFIQHMPYADHWVKEMKEQYCFWSFDQWIHEVESAGFEVMEGSRAYVNEWRVQNHFKNDVKLFGKGTDPIGFPVTNMVLCAVKPS